MVEGGRRLGRNKKKEGRIEEWGGRGWVIRREKKRIIHSRPTLGHEKTTPVFKVPPYLPDYKTNDKIRGSLIGKLDIYPNLIQASLPFPCWISTALTLPQNNPQSQSHTQTNTK